jgi:capsular polysaccharide export protein
VNNYSMRDHGASSPAKVPEAQCFLFLQGPISSFFSRLADALAAQGHRILRVNLCAGDWLLWRRSDAVSYRGSLDGWLDFVQALMARERVTDLVLLAEQRPHHRIAIAAARAAGIRVTVTDFGYLRPDWITLEPDGMSALSRFPRTPEAIRTLAEAVPAQDLRPIHADSFPAQAIWDVAYHLLSWLLWFLYPGYRSHQIHHPVINYLSTGWRLLMRRRRTAAARRSIAAIRKNGRPWWVFPMQMEVDYSLRAYSRFPDGVTPLQAVIESFARCAPDNAILAVKIHPLDPGIRNWAGRVGRIARQVGVAERVVFLDGGALNKLLDGASGVVTVNSTVGLWALRAGVPTMTLGAAVYDVADLTWQGTLDAFWQQATPPDPDLLSAFVRAMAGTIQLRGVYYREPGLSVAVQEGAARLQAPAQAALLARLGPAGGGTAKAPHAAIGPLPPRPVLEPVGEELPELLAASGD